MMQLKPSSEEQLNWLSNDCATKYQALLLDHPQIWFEKPTTVNPATRLPGDNSRVLTCDHHKMKDETGYFGVAVATLTETICTYVRYLSPESGTDGSNSGSQMGRSKG
ncbi:hypothetical protein STEG23_034134 [Scotinomys teguina]